MYHTIPFFALRHSQIPQTVQQVTVAWKHLTHPNIVPLLGATIDPPQLISDRMPGGDLTEYIVSHPDADRASLVSDASALLYETSLSVSCLVLQRVSDTCIHAI